MTEVHFYHVQRQPLERVLPALLAKCLERGWRATVQAASEERSAALDEALWTFADESFLPHATAREGDADLQPVYLTIGTENPNGSRVRFFLEGSAPLPVLEGPDGAAYERAIVLFDGQDPDQLADARQHWKSLRQAGHAVTYWQQDDNGQWEKRA